MKPSTSLLTALLLAAASLLAAPLLTAQAASGPATAAADTAPTEEQIAVALADLAQAGKLEEAAARADAVARNAGVANPKVVKALAKFLKDKERTVRLAAIEALGRTQHADALKELHRLCQSDSKLRSDEDLYAALLREIGRHGDESSVKVLIEDAWKVPAAPVVKARLYALGNIRAKASVVQLMDLLNTDPTLPWSTSPYMGDFRVALERLTGVDRGGDKDAWRTWWREQEKSLKVAAQPPRMADDLQAQWDSFWSVPERTPAAVPAAPPAGSAPDRMLWFNDGGGSFTKSADFYWAFPLDTYTVADVNADGAADIVGGGVRLGFGDGSFAEYQPGGVEGATGDFDGDGDLDVFGAAGLYLNALY